MNNPEWIRFPTHEHAWGGLSFAEAGRHVGFPVRRVYWIHGVPAGAYRGGHAHHAGREVVVAVHGRCRLTLLDPEGGRTQWEADNPRRGVLVPPGWWTELDDFADGTVLLVLAEVAFRENNYEREPERFFHVRPLPHPVSRPRP